MSSATSSRAAASSPRSPPSSTRSPAPCATSALAIVGEWIGQLETAVSEAQAEDAIDADEDPAQIAFELDAYLLLANAQYVATGDPAALDRSRRATGRLLQSIAPASASTP